MSNRVPLALPVLFPLRGIAMLAGRASGIRPFRRRALTLVELILVLSLLVIIGGLSAPLLEGTFSRSRLNHGGDLLRAAWSRARLSAMETGQPHVFLFEPQGRRYEIMSQTELAETIAAALLPEEAGQEYDVVDIVRLSEDRLPDGIVFASGRVLALQPAAADQEPQAVGKWSAPIVFHPDGSTSDAVVLLSNDRQMKLRVTLRGLTGISRAAEVGSEVTP